jgi:hypothetical protein
MFVNIQHAVTALIVGSASIDYEPAVLIGRPLASPSQARRHQRGFDPRRASRSPTCPTKNWTVTASYDYDNVDSGISVRGMNRSRLGLSATVVF